MQSITEKTTPSNPQKETEIIKTPLPFKLRRVIINVRNKDNRGFEYAILSAQHHNEIKADHSRPSKYKKYLGKFDFTGIEFPVSLEDTDKFEKQNPGIGVNVYGYDEEVYILRINEEDPQNAIDLLLITNEENQNQNHYCWIKNFSKLMEITEDNGDAYFCHCCFKKFSSSAKLRYHLIKCIENQKI